MFLVGGGGGCSYNSGLGTPGGGGGGYTKTYKKDTAGYRDGNAITITPGQTIEIIVGAGVRGANGGYSQFMSSLYRAEGGHLSQWNGDGNGGSGGVGVDRSTHSVGGSDGAGSGGTSGQGHTTRDFGESNGKRNAAGGASSYNKSGGETSQPGTSDYTEGINTIIIGHNKCWKQEINIGKRNNQNFVSIPFNVFISMISYKATLEGINVKIVEESYTSKCSFLDNERICKHKSYKGRRTKRGLFKTSFGRTINADINGAFNIIRKSEKESFDVTMLPEGGGFWWNPVRISV